MLEPSGRPSHSPNGQFPRLWARHAPAVLVLFSSLTVLKGAPIVLSIMKGVKHMDKQPEKVEYEKPKVRDYGDLTELTAGTHNGFFTDAAFPPHTAFNKLTLSSS